MMPKNFIKFKIATNKKWIHVSKRVLYFLYFLYYSVPIVQLVQNRTLKKKKQVDNPPKKCANLKPL